MNKKTVDREHKDVTCAVRLPKSLYDSLVKAAEMINSSLSDVIREAIVTKIELIKEELLQKQLKNDELRKKLADLAEDGDPMSRKRIQDIMELIEKAP